jgi:hypothetical protein
MRLSPWRSETPSLTSQMGKDRANGIAIPNRRGKHVMSLVNSEQRTMKLERVFTKMYQNS